MTQKKEQRVSASEMVERYLVKLRMHQKAMERFSKTFALNAALFSDVASGLSSKNANRILDAALDLSGSPYHACAAYRILSYAETHFDYQRREALKGFLDAFRVWTAGS